MPSIKERTGFNLKGFEPVDNPHIPPSGIIPMVPKSNPMIRTPLPPMNADLDSLRQFDESGSVPTRRVIPLPAATSGGGSGSTTVVTNVITPSAGGGGGSTSSATLKVASLTLSVPSLGAGGNFLTSVTMAQAFQLIQLLSNQPLEVRVYGSFAAQGADIARATDQSPPFETVSGIISDVVLDVFPYQWGWQNRIGANTDAIPTSTVYVTVINPSVSGTLSATLTFIYLPLT